MIDLLGPTGTVTMNDILVSVGVLIAASVRWAQREKDSQLKARDETIDFLKKQIIYLQEQIIARDDGK